MPRIVINYENTLMYKLVCNDLNITNLYVGQTTNFTTRKNAHKSDCCKVGGLHYDYKVYQIIRKNGGWSNWCMVEIEKFPCTDSKEAKKRERYWIETLNATLNCQIPLRTPSEAKKKCNIANKERREVSKYECKCGGRYNLKHKARHYKTAKHLAYSDIDLAI
jgi:hypothetical protein